MGPRTRYLGSEVPTKELIWQDPILAFNHKLIDAKDIASLKSKILASDLSISELVSTVWASTSTLFFFEILPFCSKHVDILHFDCLGSDL
jgi:catalase-peroxidase